MGFSTIAASVILFAGVLFLSGLAANAMLEAQRETSQAERDKTLRDEETRSTQMTLQSSNWQGNKLHVYLTNTGDSVLEIARLQIIVDGTLAPGVIGLSQVDGKNNVDLWAPGQELYLRLDTSPKPNRVYVVAENGLGLTIIP